MSKQTELALRFTVEDSNLLSALRYSNYQSQKNSDPYLPQARTPKQETIIGTYFPASGIFTFIGKVYNRHALPFTLKPNTRTYINFIKILLNELQNAEKNSHGKEKKQIFKSISYIEKIISDEISTFNDSRTLDLCPDDFEVITPDTSFNCSTRSLNKIKKHYLSLLTSNQNTKNLVSQLQEFRVLDCNQTKIAQISGIFSLQLEEFSTDSTTSNPQILTPEPPRLHFIEMPSIEFHRDKVKCSVIFSTEEDISTLELFFHWGRYNEESPWIDTQVKTSDIKQIGKLTWQAEVILSPTEPGNYGVTCFSRYVLGETRRWLGVHGEGDSTFAIESTKITVENNAISAKSNRCIEKLKFSLEKSLSSSDSFLDTLHKYKNYSSFAYAGYLLNDLILNSPENLQKFITITKEIEQKKFLNVSEKAKFSVFNDLIKRFGIGETVFITPEGHHAIAGGLAQVIIGLTNSFNNFNIPTTIISPIYHEASGSKHKSLSEIVKDGLVIQDTKVPIRLIGSIQVPYGPTYFSGSRVVKEFPRVISAEVYKAVYKNIKLYFLAHRTLASKLYPEQSSSEQIRSSIFLSRGALELIRDGRFGLSPQTIITNDWLTAPVHLFLKTDSSYTNLEKLRTCKAIHLIHNGGRAYQGRFMVNQNEEDLWPLFGLPKEHFFGTTDPDDISFFNFTAMAANHINGALLTVSKPYAQELLSKSASDSLSRLLEKKSSLLYGISNGIPLTALRQLCWDIGERSQIKHDISPNSKFNFTEKRFLSRLLSYKEYTKLQVQKNYYLEESSNAIIISFIGRLVEQKGTSLLTEKLGLEGLSFLETILKKHPQVQLIIGGPTSPVDTSAKVLQETIRSLSKTYPGRIQGIFDFIPHIEVLEITLGSDLFLMPSRYEPGGISQLEALATGTLVVARNVGGISATLTDYNENLETGNAFLFDEYSGSALLYTIERALSIYKDHKKRKLLSLRAARCKNDWKDKLPFYLTLIQEINGVFRTSNTSFLNEAKSKIKEISALSKTTVIEDIQEKSALNIF